jgi:dTDP-4-dehydrorhamnose reductase
MRILILGGGGMLGHELWRYLEKRHEVWVTLRKDFHLYKAFGLFDKAKTIIISDILRTELLNNAIQCSQPSTIINCVGVIKQVKESHDPIKSIEINSLFPHKLVQIATQHGIRVLHVSTDCVFSGRAGNYTEDDISDAEDLYGRTKFLGEVNSPNALTLRTSIIGHELNSCYGLIEWFLSQEGHKIKGYKRAIYSGFTTLEMSRIIGLILECFPDLQGVWQVSSEPISKFELLGLAKQFYGWRGEIVPDEDFKCDRSLNSGRFRSKTNYVPPSWEGMIEELAATRKFKP